MLLGLALELAGGHLDAKAHQSSNEEFSHFPSSPDFNAKLEQVNRLKTSGLVCVFCGPLMALGLWWCLGGQGEPASPRSAPKTPRRG
jgi:hypothetical protein